MSSVDPDRPSPVRGPAHSGRSGARVLALACAAGLAVGAPVLLAAPASAAPAVHTNARVSARSLGAAATVVIRAGHSSTPTLRRLAQRAAVPSAAVTAAPTATFAVTYTGAWTAAAKADLAAAFATWGHVLVSSVPIRVTADWSPLGAGVLGSAAPDGVYQVNGRWVPSALSDALVGREQDPTLPDIDAQFSSTMPWYTGTDGLVPGGKYDLESVMTHELGHGLGFVGSLYDDSSGLGTVGDTQYDVPFALDDLVVDGAGHQVDATYPNNSTALGDALSGADGTLRLSGANATAADGGHQPLLYTPRTYEEGSSTFHLDEASFPPGSPNALMTPSLTDGESDHAVGAVVTGLMKDLGWSAVAAGPTPIQTKYAALGGASSVVGTPVGYEYPVVGGTAQNYTRGRIYWSAGTGAHEVQGSILSRYLATGGPAGYLRMPTSDELAAPGATGRLGSFAGGRVYWSSTTGAHDVHGSILTRYTALGASAGVLHLPTTDETSSADRVGRYNLFSGANGAIYWSPASGAHVVRGGIRNRWVSLGAERGRLGYPTVDEYAVAGGERSGFQHGTITWSSATGAITVAYS